MSTIRRAGGQPHAGLPWKPPEPAWTIKASEPVAMADLIGELVTMDEQKPRELRPLPEPEPDANGAELFAFVLRHSCTATLSDNDLARALASSQVFAGDADVSDLVRRRYHATRTMILTVIRDRMRQDRPSTVPMGSPVDAKPNTGPMAPLKPAPELSPAPAARAMPEIAF